MTAPKNIPLKLPPGIVRDQTDYAAQGRYVDCNYVRFRDDLPEKIGGWQSNPTYAATGVPRSVLLWRSLAEENLMAVGTHSHVHLAYQGALYDITPLRASVTVGADPIETTDTLATVTITHASHGAQMGDFVVISGAAAVGGITLAGEYEVVSVPTINTYTITHSVVATSSATGGGASVLIKYLVYSGFSSVAGGLGWSAGPWGDASWGDARTVGNAVATEITYWSFDLWGEDLVMTKRNAATYVWDTSAGPGTRAALITNAPATAKFTKVNQDIRILVSYGAYDSGASASDPMLIKWSDQDDYTTWTASAAGEAGDFRLTSGTRIVSAIETRNQTLIFTDTSLYAQQYTGQPYIFSHRLLAEDVNIIGQKAVTENNGTVFWIGKNNFFMYTGQVVVLPCPMRRYVFDNMNRDHEQKCFAAINFRFQEIWFFYPRGSNTEPSHYVAYYYGDPQKNIWHDGVMDRTCWADGHKFLSNPLAYDSTGVYYTHEYGDDSDGAAMNAYIESGVIEMDHPTLGAGGGLVLADKLIPDATATGDMKFTVYTKKYPQSTEETTKGPYTITTITDKTSFRAKGRQMRIRFESDGASVAWKIGVPRIRMKVVGNR
jgi:hypothetical protein